MQLRPHQQRVLDVMLQHRIGQVIVPTGGGKTACMIFDAMRQDAGTIVIVAPRIMLATQLSAEFLEFITDAEVMHVHSGETHHFSSTKPAEIYQWVRNNTDTKRLIFTTYNSLERVVDAGIPVATIYFDEAHNSVQRNFYIATEAMSSIARRCYFFTATPKHSLTPSKPGMNNPDVYGQVIEKVSAPELIQGGYIIPPKVITDKLPETINGDIAGRDRNNLLNVIDNNESMEKVLICATKTKDIMRLVSQTDFAFELDRRGYSLMWITAKHGAFVDGKKVNREVFFDTLNAWGKEDGKKFVIIHHSILSEGINVSGLSACVMMRAMDYIGIAQTIGRVIRLHKDDAKGLRDGSIQPGNLSQYTKSFGLVHIPVFSNVGISTAKKVQAVVDTIFQQGEPAISVVRR